jgi:hypothetical protein
MCWALNHQNIIEIAQWHISLSDTRPRAQFPLLRPVLGQFRLRQCSAAAVRRARAVAG